MPLALEFATARRLRAGDARLQSSGDLALTRGLLSDYAPHDEAQRATRARMLVFIDEHPTDAHLRGLAVGHLTASALVVDASGERALLTHHRKLERWLQLGGHCDGDANLMATALREAVEESGIADLCIRPEPIDLDIHSIPARPGEPEHSHLDTRFVVFAPAGARAVVSDESHELGWFSPAELAHLAVDDSVRRLFERVFAR